MGIRQRIKEIVFSGFVALLIAIILMATGEGVARSFSNPDDFDQQQKLDWADLQVIVDPTAKWPSADLDAYKKYDWVEDWKASMAEVPGEPYLRYEPFVLWATTTWQSRYVNFDQNGFRRTINPIPENCNETKTIFVFGGSTIAGEGIFRDIDVIPSLFSKYLNENSLKRCFEVRNYAASGYAQDNEFVLLTRLLSQGERPDIVIFYDGGNDVIQKIVWNKPHMAYDFFNRVSNIWSGDEAVGNLFTTISQKIRSKSALHSLLAPTSSAAPATSNMALPSEVSLIAKRTNSLVEKMCGNMKVVSGLGKSFGFQTVLALQPVIYTKQHPASEELSLLALLKKHAPVFQSAFESGYERIVHKFEQPDHCGVRFINLTAVIETEEPVFVDYIHISPLGNDFVARALFNNLAPQLLN